MQKPTSISSAFAGLVFAARLASGAPPPPPAPPDPVVEKLPNGELNVSAKGARLVDVLRRVADAAEFDVDINDAVERPPVWATIRAATAEEAVRQILRRRSYALAFSPDGDLERVTVLSPADPQADAKRRLAERREAQRLRAEQQRLEQQRLQAGAVHVRRLNAR
jgi:hypothetical protein